MHILHLVDALYVGGAERMLVELANRAVADGHRVSVCVSRAVGPYANKLDSRIALVSLERKRRFDVSPMLRLARWIRRQAVDVVQCHGLSSFSFAALLAATRLIRTPLILHDHRGWASEAPVPRWLLAGKRYVASYVAVDERQLAWAARAGIPSSRTCVVPNALDFDEIKRRSTPIRRLDAAGQRTLVSVGGLRREKAIDVLLDATALVRSPVKLFIIGGDADPGYAAACRSRAAMPDLRDKVTFLGQREDAISLAATADLAVHAARTESGPLVLLEYAALGVPFVSTKVGGISVSLAKEGVGRFVSAEDPDALATAIDDVLALGTHERAAAAATMTRVARERFDIAAVMPQWYRLYAEVTR